MTENYCVKCKNYAPIEDYETSAIFYCCNNNVAGSVYYYTDEERCPNFEEIENQSSDTKVNKNG